MRWQTVRSVLKVITAVFVWTAWGSLAQADGVAKYVIHISVDGAGSGYVQALVDKDMLPNFKRFQTEGACTNHARTDFDYTITLPNHTAMVTGRPVLDKKGPSAAIPGHLWIENGEPGDKTLHSNCKSYVKSTFDVAHDAGLTTAMYASKTKFKLYDQSYNEANGAPDMAAPDNGRDKIDVCVIEEKTELMTSQFIVSLHTKPANYNFVHFRNPDSAGHAHGWGSPEQVEALRIVDGYLGMIFSAIASNDALKDKTTLILSADHGGFGKDHSNNTDPLDFTIPFYTWGAGVQKGADLYKINDTRQQPGRPDFVIANLQPIRNGDGGNLAMNLLGLGPIPDSYINAAHDLVVKKKEEKKDEKKDK
jgi:hypothetical protein